MQENRLAPAWFQLPRARRRSAGRSSVARSQPGPDSAVHFALCFSTGMGLRCQEPAFGAIVRQL